MCYSIHAYYKIAYGTTIKEANIDISVQNQVGRVMKISLKV